MNEPLTQESFNQQVQQLFAQHGANTFAAVAGEYPLYTLFVDGDTVVAESNDSPRHRYGSFCELTTPLAGEELTAHIIDWLEQGEAYNLYLSMNVCRYNCG